MTDKPLLFNRKIGVSVSESERYNKLGYSKMTQSDITGELVKYLMINGVHLMYGGDLRENGYVWSFSALAAEYHPAARSRKCMTNYFAWPTHLSMTDHQKGSLGKMEKIKVPAHRAVPAAQRKQASFSDYLDMRYCTAMSMTAMRTRMVKSCEARVFIGGRLTDYFGFYPGVLEEAYLSLQNKQPMYFTGALSGATSIIIRALKGEDTTSLGYELHDWYPGLEDLYRHSQAKKSVPPRPEKLLDAFRKLGVKGLSQLNKLSEKENETLFETEHFHEILYHNLIGLKRAL